MSDGSKTRIALIQMQCGVDPAANMSKAIAQIQVTTYQAALDVCDRPQPASEYEAPFGPATANAC